MDNISVSTAHGGVVNYPPGPLAVGASITCVEPIGYVVAQRDVDRQSSFQASATVYGQGPSDISPVAYGPRTARIAVTPAAPLLAVTTAATVNPAGHQNAAAAGDTVSYAYVLTNRGNVTLSSISVTDAQAGPVVCPAVTLAVQASMTCAPATPYRVTQADVDAGLPIAGSATAAATGPASPTVHSYGPYLSAIQPVPASPALSVSGSPRLAPDDGQQAARIGDTVILDYRITNAGNVTMSAIGLAGASCPLTQLLPGAATVCSAPSYTVTSADIKAGQPLVYSTVAVARAPGTLLATPFGQATVTVPVEAPHAELSISIDSEVVARGAAADAVTTAATAHEPRAGDRIRYHYQVGNAGNLRLDHLGVQDQLVGDAVCDSTTLDIGETTRCTAVDLYQVTQSDIDSGVPIRNLAAASALETGTQVSHTSGTVSLTVPVEPAAPAIVGVQSADWVDADGDHQLSPKDPVVSTFAITNTGNVTLVGLVVKGLPVAITCAKTTLAPGESVVCTSAAYRLTATQIATGKHIALADLSAGTTAGNAEVDGQAPATVVAPSPKPTPSPSPKPTPGGSTSPSPTAPAKPALPQPLPSRTPSAVPASPVTSPPAHGAEPMPTTGPDTAAAMLTGMSLLIGGAVLLTATVVRRRAYRAR
jgi:hypothetical protein